MPPNDLEVSAASTLPYDSECTIPYDPDNTLDNVSIDEERKTASFPVTEACFMSHSSASGLREFRTQVESDEKSISYML